MAAVIESEVLRGKAAASQGITQKGRDMDDVLRRLGNVESSVERIRDDVSKMCANVSAIQAALPALASNAEVQAIKAALPALATNAEVQAIKAALPALATKAELEAVDNHISKLETRMTRWVIVTLTTGIGLAFTIARFVH